MKEMLGYQVDEEAASLKMSLRFKLLSDNVNWNSCNSRGANVVILSPVRSLWRQQATSLDVLMGP